MNLLPPGFLRVIISVLISLVIFSALLSSVAATNTFPDGGFGGR